MKRYSKISGMTIVTCDARACAADFRSCSIPKVIDQQLEAAKWTILISRDYQTGEKKRNELCPAHKPRPRMEGGPPMMGVPGRTSH